MGPSGRFTHVMIYWTVWDRLIQVLYLGRAPHTKETLPDFLKWRRVTRHPLVFRGLTGSQRTPGFRGVTSRVRVGQICLDFELEISGILLMVDLRVVDISGFDVILDKDELTTHRVVSDCDLRRVIIPETILELCRFAYACE